MSSTDPLFDPVVVDAAASARSPRRSPPSRLPPLANWALFLDLDGTLCDYRDNPADVALTPALRTTLSLLATRLDSAGMAELRLPFEPSAAVRLPAQAQLQPMRVLGALAARVRAAGVRIP